MNSRFKFRAWNMVAKFFLDWEKFIDYENDQMEIVGNDYRIYNDDEFVLQQCTGLFDKNGKVIYEGDILKSTDTINQDSIYNVVEWNNGCFTICEGEWGLDKFTLDISEIIGNIYENPELLNQKEEV